MRKLDIREELARIDQALADHRRRRQEGELTPWQIALIGMSAGAALFVAGAAFVKLIGG